MKKIAKVKGEQERLMQLASNTPPLLDTTIPRFAEKYKTFLKEMSKSRQEIRLLPPCVASAAAGRAICCKIEVRLGGNLHKP